MHAAITAVHSSATVRDPWIPDILCRCCAFVQRRPATPLQTIWVSSRYCCSRRSGSGACGCALGQRLATPCHHSARLVSAGAMFGPFSSPLGSRAFHVICMMRGRMRPNGAECRVNQFIQTKIFYYRQQGASARPRLQSDMLQPRKWSLRYMYLLLSVQIHHATSYSLSSVS